VSKHFDGGFYAIDFFFSHSFARSLVIGRPGSLVLARVRKLAADRQWVEDREAAEDDLLFRPSFRLSDDVRRRRRLDERKRHVWKLLPDRKIFRRDSEPSEPEHVSARFGQSSGLCPGDLIDGQSFPLPPSPDDLRYSSLLSFRFPQCISLRSVNVRSMSRFKARSTPMRACITKVPAFRGADQATDRGLPLLEHLLGLGKFHDVVGGIAPSHELAPTGSWIGLSKGRAQAAASLDSAISYPPSGMC
jgi:hypothetical protein